VRYGLESTKNPKAELVFSCPREFWGDFQKWRGFRCGACAAERDDDRGMDSEFQLAGPTADAETRYSCSRQASFSGRDY
jgi:hypothetical protein